MTMRVVERVGELQELCRRHQRAGGEVALVPTMGALHAGHLSLVRAARSRRHDLVVASIFVNPLQFGPGEDLARYPRPLDADTAALAAAGVDILFHPSVEEMYPDGNATRVVPGPVADLYEGAIRPGHFVGVATVVTRLFGAALADNVYFGQKDAQQVAVIRATVRDLALPVRRLEVCPTVRERDGLAMSSRNGYLTEAEWADALVLSRSLAEVQRQYQAGTHDGDTLVSRLKAVLATRPAVVVDYADIVDGETFRPAAPGRLDGALAVVAARVGRTRLIDNCSPAGNELLKFAPLDLQTA